MEVTIDNSASAERKMLYVYNASAGSGKTFTLAARYIAILLNGESARSILAVTFTNKATAEMKERILQNLYQLSINAEDENISQFLKAVRSFMPESKAKMSVEDIQKMAALQLREILNDYDHFTITTIDAFLQMLLSEVARIAGLRTNYQVELHDNDVIDSAIDFMVSNLSKMDEGTRKGVLQLITSRNEEEKNWDIRKELKALSKQLKAGPYLNGKDRIESFINQNGNEHFANYRNSLKNGDGANAVDRMRRLFNDYSTKMKQCDVGFHRNWLDSFINGVEKSLSGQISSDKFFKELSNQMVEYLNNDEKFHKKYQGDVDPETYRSTILEMNKLCAPCKKYLLNVKFSTEHLGELGLLNSISEQVTKINREANRILLSSTPILLRQILEKGEDTLFVMERAGIRFNHIMIDEFQDTSTIQWDNFQPLLEEILGKGSALLVGDVKQSIYRWRGGDWNILMNINKEKLKHYFDVGQGRILPLTRNFRSERNIVEFNLTFFKEAAKVLDSMIDNIPSESLKKEKSNTIQEIYNENFDSAHIENFCRSTKKNGLVDVKLFPYTGRSKTESNENMLKVMFDEIVKLLGRGLNPNDILILVRKKRDMNDIVTYLNNHREEEGYANITLVSSDAYMLKSSLSVAILISALRYLANTDDKISLTFLARHYQKDICKRPISWSDFIDSFPSCLPAEFDTKALLSKPLYEMTEELVHILLYNENGERTLNDDSYVYSFLDNILNYVSNNGSNLSGFLEYWDTSLSEATIPVPAYNKDIRIMTIHKAKGLEAHTVMIPMCDWALEEDKPDNILWCEPQVEPFNALPLAPVTPCKSLTYSIYCDDYAREHFYQRVDNLNLLYVAFTRPQKNLFVYSRVPDKIKDVTSVGDLLVDCLGRLNVETPNNGQCFQQLAKIGECNLTTSHSTTNTTNRLKLNRTDYEIKLSKHPCRMEFRQSNSSHDFVEPMENDEVIDERNAFIRKGNLCHRIFSAIRVPEDSADVLQSFRQEGIIDSDQKKQELSELIENCWKNEQVRSWFDSSWTLFRECNILKRMPDGTLKKNRPDRVMIRENETIVVDYKFGVKKQEYEKQVREYMSLLSQMGHNEVKGYLWYVYNNEIVEVLPENHSK